MDRESRAFRLVEALSPQAWKGPGYLDTPQLMKIVQQYLDEERDETIAKMVQDAIVPLKQDVQEWKSRQAQVQVSPPAKVPIKKPSTPSSKVTSPSSRKRKGQST